MASDHVKRKLAAIVAADVVGYSRLMGADEAGTLARLKQYRRELIDPKNRQYRGRVVKTTGWYPHRVSECRGRGLLFD